MKSSGINPNKDALEDGTFDKNNVKQKAEQAKKALKKRKEKDGIMQKYDVSSDSDEEEVKGLEAHLMDSVKYLHPLEIKEQLHLLWNRDGELLNILFGNIFYTKKNKYRIEVKSGGIGLFFIDNILVPPNRFRPENKSSGDGSVYLHTQTAALTKILNLSADMRLISNSINNSKKDKDTLNKNVEEKKVTETNKIDEALLLNTKGGEMDKKNNFKDLVAKWIELQDAVNVLYDSQKALKQNEKESKGKDVKKTDSKQAKVTKK